MMVVAIAAVVRSECGFLLAISGLFARSGFMWVVGNWTCVIVIEKSMESGRK